MGIFERLQGENQLSEDGPQILLQCYCIVLKRVLFTRIVLSIKNPFFAFLGLKLPVSYHQSPSYLSKQFHVVLRKLWFKIVPTPPPSARNRADQVVAAPIGSIGNYLTDEYFIHNAKTETCETKSIESDNFRGERPGSDTLPSLLFTHELFLLCYHFISGTPVCILHEVWPNLEAAFVYLYMVASQHIPSGPCS